MSAYDKNQIKQQLTIQDIFSFLEEYGGEPYYESPDVIISRTICHNTPQAHGSYKLYYYENNSLFHCYSGCPTATFDIFDLAIKIFKLQFNQEINLNQAVRWVAYKFGIIDDIKIETTDLEDWNRFELYDTASLSTEQVIIPLQTYDDAILNNFNYSVKIQPWLQEGISDEAIKYNHISYYPGGNQIIIPHYNINGQLVGIRGRTLSKEDAEMYGKYRPIRANGITYAHPLGLNLYNLNNTKQNISLMQKAIVFESEKSALMFQSYFGQDCDISVACCGSNLSAQQVALLLQNGAQEITVAFDRDFERYQDDVYKAQVQRYKTLHKKFHNKCTMSFIFDKHNRLTPKQSPIDAGPATFMQLYNERIIL
jgi:hypothetical protein